jgi:hypothetical protein
MKRAALCLIGMLSLAAADVAAAQAAYPAKGQGPERQQKDEAACANWATGQTGYDPARPPVVAKAEPAPVTGSGSRVRGAALGAAVSGIAGNDVGEGAARGAVVGGVTRRVRNRREANAANEASAQQVQAAQASWASARRACLKGRGYTVD